MGATGFIGSAVVRALSGAGYQVTGFGRDAAQARRVLGEMPYQAGDLRALADARDWADYLAETDLVVNCAGVLQDMAPGDLENVHHLAIAALGRACADRGLPVIQISAAGAGPQASTEFMRSKARGDAALTEAGPDLWILRPGLVIGQGAFGGTLMLRMLAAFPLVQPLALAQAPVQSVALSELSEAVVAAAKGDLPPGVYDLVEDQPRPLKEVIARTRSWLGFSAARREIEAPSWLVRLIARGADGLGRLGWRSPLRSTAVQVLEQGVTGDPQAYRAATGRGVPALPLIMAGLPCGREQRIAARMALMMPVCVAVLSLFWIVSGLVGLLKTEAAGQVLTDAGWGRSIAEVSVLFWSLVDLGLGAAILVRRYAARACLGMALVSAFYLVAAALVTPSLWADPLGPMVKVVPGLVLALVTRELLEER